MVGGDIGGSDSNGTSLTALFELGLIAGMVTFGGAYTTLPFICQAAVLHGKWLTQGQFLDSLAITNVMPTPLVSFVTCVGWVGHGLSGAVVMTVGIFLPAMSFTLIGHSFFESRRREPLHPPLPRRRLRRRHRSTPSKLPSPSSAPSSYRA